MLKILCQVMFINTKIKLLSRVRERKFLKFMEHNRQKSTALLQGIIDTNIHIHICKHPRNPLNFLSFKVNRPTVGLSLHSPNVIILLYYANLLWPVYPNHSTNGVLVRMVIQKCIIVFFVCRYQT